MSTIENEEAISQQLDADLDDLRKQAEEGAAALDYMRRLSNANRTVREKEAAYRELKEQTKEAKEELETAHDELSYLVSAWDNDQDRPLLNASATEDDPRYFGNLIEDVLELNVRLATTLADAGIETVGQLQRVRESGKWPEGIGVKGQQAVADVLDDYFASQNIEPEDDDQDDDDQDE